MYTLEKLAQELGVSESKAKAVLAEAAIALEEVTPGLVKDFKAALGSSALTPVKGEMAKTQAPAPKAQPKQVAPAKASTQAAAPKATTVADAQSANQKAMLDVANAALTQETEIFNKALELADELDAQEVQHEIEDLAEEIRATRKAQRQAKRSFLSNFANQSTAVVLNQFAGVLPELTGTVEEETLDAELVA